MLHEMRACSLNLRNAYDREMEFRMDIQLGHLYPLSTGGGDLTYYVPVDMYVCDGRRWQPPTRMATDR